MSKRQTVWLVGSIIGVIIIAIAILILPGLLKVDPLMSTNISFNVDKIYLEVNTTINLKSYLVKSDNSVEYYHSNNVLVAEVETLTGIVSAKHAGTCTIVASVKSNGQVFESSVEIIVSEKKIYPTGLAFEKSTIQISIGTTQYVQLKIYGPNNITEVPNISIENNRVRYNYLTGELYAKELGQDEITANILKEDGTLLIAKLTIEIVEAENPIKLSSNEVDLQINQTKMITFRIDGNYLQYVKLEILTGNIEIQMNDYQFFSIKATTVGQSTIKVSLTENPSVYTILYVNVVWNRLC